MRAKVPTVFRRIQGPSLIVNKKFAVNRPIVVPILLVPKLINVKPIHVKIPNRVQVPFFPKTNWNFNQRNWFSDDIKKKIEKKVPKEDNCLKTVLLFIAFFSISVYFGFFTFLVVYGIYLLLFLL
jgi:hypothetical protein